MKRGKIAHWCLIASMSFWLIIIAITPVGGWHESNPFREYYMTAFTVTSVLTLISMWFSYKVNIKQ